MKPPKFEHVFDICFSILSDEEDPSKISREDQINGLRESLAAELEERDTRICHQETYDL
jgi:hypothetical protein|tara:strand:- start:1017 stop:1193 length:177 start_codon:yes stop_codon:yes gene_type:complete